MKNILRGSRVYLAGPIEMSDGDSSSSWRCSLANELKSIGVISWDPLVKPKWFTDEVGQLSLEDQRNDLIKFDEYNKSRKNSTDMIFAYERNMFIRSCCLRLTSSCDFVICLIDGPTIGTFEEINLANQQGKPIIFIHKNGKIDSCWRYVQFMNCIHCYSINEVIKYLKKIDNGEIEVDHKKWIFLPNMWPNSWGDSNENEIASR